MQSPPAYRREQSRSVNDKSLVVPSGKVDGDLKLRPLVLLVDDDKFILTSLVRLLRQEPYEIMTASSGAEAIDILDKNEVTLVVSDQVMPEMTGLELLSRVQKGWPETIRIILSGYTKVDVIIDAINSGTVYKYFTKPWNDEELKLNVRRAIEQYDLQLQNWQMADQICEQNRKLSVLNEQLGQRAKDADSGLAIMRELMDAVEVGVFGLDETGALAWQSHWASEVLSLDSSASVGIPLSELLPHEFYESVTHSFEGSKDAADRRVTFDGRTYEFRTQRLPESSSTRGSVVAFWDVGD